MSKAQNTSSDIPRGDHYTKQIFSCPSSADPRRPMGVFAQGFKIGAGYIVGKDRGVADSDCYVHVTFTNASQKPSDVAISHFHISLKSGNRNLGVFVYRHDSQTGRYICQEDIQYNANPRMVKEAVGSDKAFSSLVNQIRQCEQSVMNLMGNAARNKVKPYDGPILGKDQPTHVNVPADRYGANGWQTASSQQVSKAISAQQQLKEKLKAATQDQSAEDVAEQTIGKGPN